MKANNRSAQTQMLLYQTSDGTTRVRTGSVQSCWTKRFEASWCRKIRTMNRPASCWRASMQLAPET